MSAMAGQREDFPDLMVKIVPDLDGVWVTGKSLGSRNGNNEQTTSRSIGEATLARANMNVDSKCGR